LVIESKYIDRDIIKKLKSGDKKAFQRIFNAYSERLFNFTFSYLKDSYESEEIVQEIFLRLWENRTEVDEEKSFQSFLYRMAVNKVYNNLKHKVVCRKYENYLNSLDQSYSVSPEEHLYRKDLVEKLRELLSMLPEQKRKIFEMSKLEGLSNAEISKQLDLSIRTVENQIYRATKFLKDNLKDEYLFILVSCFGSFLFNYLFI